MLGFLFKGIKKKEYKKFLSTWLMFFSIATAYAITRRIKDAVILSRMNAEVITFIKVGIVLPTSIIFVLLYNWASSRINKDKFTYILQIPFLLWFTFYGVIELINTDFFNQICFSINIDAGRFTFLTSLFHEIDMVLRNLPHVIFYVITEMYGSLVLSFMFWRYVNEYTKLNDVGRFYPLYALAGSVSVIFSGLLGIFVSKFISKSLSSSQFNSMSSGINVLVAVFFIIMTNFAYAVSLKEHKNNQEVEENPKPAKSKKKKLGFMASLKTLLENKTVLYLTIAVLGYMASINIVEVSWKKAVKQYYLIEMNSPQGFNSFQGLVQILSGITTVIAAFLCNSILKNFGWTISALINPILVGCSGVVFFLLLIFGSSLFTSQIGALFGAVIVGLIQNIASKACKYSFFDTTKEMALVTLDKDMRDRGKAAVDVLGGRFGKSAGSLIQQILIAIFVPAGELCRGQEIITPYLFFALCILVFIWTIAVLSLGKEVSKNSKEANK